MRLWIRADGSPEIGLGHVMRSIALAEAAQHRGVRTTHVTTPGVAAGHLARRGLEVTIVADQSDNQWIADVTAGDAVVFDGYHFGATDFRNAEELGARVGVIDDFGYGAFDVDVLVNPNLIDEHRYSTSSRTRTLLGPLYALVRREFVGCRRARTPSTGSLLITLGGADTAGLTSRVVSVVSRERVFDQVKLLVGPAASLPVGGPDWDGVEVVRAPLSVAAVFDQVDAAVSAAGSTTWELLCMGVPTALVEVADNQKHVVEGASRARAALVAVRQSDLGDLEHRLRRVIGELGDPSIQQKLNTASRELVDGRGAARILDALLDERNQRSGQSFDMA